MNPHDDIVPNITEFDAKKYSQFNDSRLGDFLSPIYYRALAFNVKPPKSHIYNKELCEFSPPLKCDPSILKNMSFVNFDIRPYLTFYNVGYALNPLSYFPTEKKTIIPHNEMTSVILANKDMSKELYGIHLMKRIDPYEVFFSGFPTMCGIDDSEIGKLKQCTNIGEHTEQYLKNNFSQFIKYKAGKISLAELIQNPDIYYDFFNKNNKHKQYATDILLCQMSKLIQGVIMFQSNNVMHFNISPDTILFDIKPNAFTFYFSDFATLQHVNKYAYSFRTDFVQNMTYSGARFVDWKYILGGIDNHDDLVKMYFKHTVYNVYKYYPLEFFLFLKKDYDKFMFQYYHRSTQATGVFDSEEWLKEINKKMKIHIPLYDEFFKEIALDGKKPIDMDMLFYYNDFIKSLTPTVTMFDTKEQFNVQNSRYYDGYRAFLNRGLKRVDIFSVAVCMQKVVNMLKEQNNISIELYLEFTDLFSQVYSPNTITAIQDAGIFFDKYQAILHKNDILYRLGYEYIPNRANLAILAKKIIPRSWFHRAYYFFFKRDSYAMTQNDSQYDYANFDIKLNVANDTANSTTNNAYKQFLKPQDFEDFDKSVSYKPQPKFHTRKASSTRVRSRTRTHSLSLTRSQSRSSSLSHSRTQTRRVSQPKQININHQKKKKKRKKSKNKQPVQIP